METFKIAGLGELLFDVLGTDEHLGGAPVNFACHAQSLGAEGLVISTIGQDDRGTRALDLLRKKGMQTQGISVLPEYQTGFVSASLDQFGVATYHFPDNVAWDHLLLAPYVRKICGELDAVCFGSLAQRSADSRKTILDFLDLLPARAARIFDVNLRQNFYNTKILLDSLERCTILKLNDEELQVIAKMFEIEGDEDTLLGRLVERFELQLGVLTRGGAGSILVGCGSESIHPGYPSEIVDTIGAGDAFTAAVTLGFLQKKSLTEINEHANKVAAWVCGRSGATPQLPEKLKLIGVRSC